MSKKKKITAGFIVLKKFNGDYKILVLTKRNGQLDLPKGGHDKDQDDFNLLNTAKREAEEECGIVIKNSDLLSGGKQFDNMIFFIAETYQEPSIRANPKSGEFEHVKAEWFEPFAFLLNAPQYLNEVAKWAINNIKKLTINQ